MRPVVEGVVARQFDHRAGAVVQQIRNVVAHERCVVVEAGLDQQVQGVARKIVGRRPVALGPGAGKMFNYLDAAVQPLSLGVALHLVGVLVEIAVVANLVAVPKHRFDSRWIALHAPGRQEERLGHVKALIGLDDARNRHLWPVAQHGQRHHAVVGAAVMIEMEDAVRIHVEGECHGAAGAIGPGNGVLNHCGLLLMSKGRCQPRRADDPSRRLPCQYAMTAPGQQSSG